MPKELLNFEKMTLLANLSYYKDISSNVAFESLVNRNTRNKEQRGGLKLAQSWFPNAGSQLNPQRLTSWLTCFGFTNAKVERDNVDKHESYIVKSDASIKKVSSSACIPAPDT